MFLSSALLLIFSFLLCVAKVSSVTRISISVYSTYTKSTLKKNDPLLCSCNALYIIIIQISVHAIPAHLHRML